MTASVASVTERQTCEFCFEALLVAAAGGASELFGQFEEPLLLTFPSRKTGFNEVSYDRARTQAFALGDGAHLP